MGARQTKSTGWYGSRNADSPSQPALLCPIHKLPLLSNLRFAIHFCPYAFHDGWSHPYDIPEWSTCKYWITDETMYYQVYVNRQLRLF